MPQPAAAEPGWKRSKVKNEKLMSEWHKIVPAARLVLNHFSAFSFLFIRQSVIFVNKFLLYFT